MTNRIALNLPDRQSFAGGQEFGDAGAYERLKGRAHFRVDPLAAAQAGVVDIEHAERDEDGLVRFATDLIIYKPVDMAKANGSLFFDTGNRGNMRAIQYFCDAPPTNDALTAVDAGNGFLFRRGYVVVAAAWQGDLLPGQNRMLLDLPIASNGAEPITGRVRTEFIASGPGLHCFPLSARSSTRAHPAVSLSQDHAVLTRRRYQTDARQPVPADQWQFARQDIGGGLHATGAENGIAPSREHIYMPGGFEPGWIYELVYEGQDPLVMGLGHVVMRDLISYLKHGEIDECGSANPLAGGVERAYVYGRSQTGRLIRDFIWRGFNGDAEGRRVFDGAMPHVSGAGGKWLNQRFANAVVAGGQQHEDHYCPADRFPFAYAETTDHNTGRADAILKRPETDPLVIHTQTATEYWQRRGSLVHTDTQGNDLPIPETVRIYSWTSTQHGSDPNLIRPQTSGGTAYLNVAQTSMLFRAMLDAMDAWAKDGTPPPASRIPTRADNTLVDYTTWASQFPEIPTHPAPQSPNQLPLMDFGPEEAAGILSQEPPRVINEAAYRILVPAVDATGIETAGVAAPMVQAPLGTYTGWNVRRRGLAGGAMHEFSGGYIPLPETPEVRAASGDPRLSITERYGDAAGYIAAIRSAAEALVKDGYMLEEDVDRVVARAADWGRPLHDVQGL
ncbi:MAG: alpha/beta hydrolase domain-containing protein [Alphaproteobacteria bacterium]